MYGAVRDDLTTRLEELRDQGLYKHELTMTTPQGAHVDVQGRGELVNLCANNYLGLANHPEMVAAAHEALDRWGYGMASVRFICGTQSLHRAYYTPTGERRCRACRARIARTRRRIARATGGER